LSLSNASNLYCALLAHPQLRKWIRAYESSDLLRASLHDASVPLCAPASMMGYDDVCLLHEFCHPYLRRELFDEGSAPSASPFPMPCARLDQAAPFPAERSHSIPNQPQIAGHPVGVHRAPMLQSSYAYLRNQQYLVHMEQRPMQLDTRNILNEATRIHSTTDGVVASFPDALGNGGTHASSLSQQFVLLQARRRTPLDVEGRIGFSYPSAYYPPSSSPQAGYRSRFIHDWRL